MQPLTKLDQTKLRKYEHWTAGNPLRMVRWIASDFIAQLETRIEQIPGFTHGDLAKRLSVSLGRVSQMMNAPGNFTLKNGVLYAGAADMNVAIVIYPANCTSAPISGDVFRACWEIAGRPKNMFDIQENSVGFAMRNSNCGMAAIGHTWGTWPSLTSGCTAKTDYQHSLIASVPVETPVQEGTPNHNA